MPFTREDCVRWSANWWGMKTDPWKMIFRWKEGFTFPMLSNRAFSNDHDRLWTNIVWLVASIPWKYWSLVHKIRVYDWDVYWVVTGMTPFTGLVYHSRSPLVTRGNVPRGRHRQALSDISSKSKFYIRSNLKSAPREKHVSSCVYNVLKSTALQNLLNGLVWKCGIPPNSF